MSRDIDPTMQRLIADMRSGKPAAVPRRFQQFNRALYMLRAPLSFVPQGTVVSIRIEAPDNNTGKYYTLGWCCEEAEGVPPEEARQQLMEQLVPRFLDLVLPLP